MGILSPPKEKAWNLHFRDDGNFIFRQLDIEKGWLIEKGANERPVRAFMKPYKLEKRFDGYKKIPAGKLTITFPGDILFDPFTQLSLNEKPEKGKGLKEKMMSGIASATIYQHEVEARPTSSLDKMIAFMGAVIVLLALSIMAQVLINRGS